jgi:DNA-binding NarL/FixJ family response regulator
MIRVMIIARHTDVREGLGTVLGLAEGIEIIEVASSLITTVRRTSVECPDVALVDLEMPAGEGYEIIRQLKRNCLDTRVIALTAYDYPAARESAIQAGASMVMVKGLEVSEMVAAIRDSAGDKERKHGNS